ncbi:MAG: hypothetical protein HOP15_04205 [Planctomycetes bacterium]|nr:hypothetical protein [Planctomycetota bacterium]
MVRTSNRVSPSRAAKVASAPVAEKIAKIASKKPVASRPSPTAKAGRMKIVWEVCSGTGKTVQTFPYPEKAAAEARTRALAHSTGRSHMLRATKIPME